MEGGGGGVVGNVRGIGGVAVLVVGGDGEAVGVQSGFGGDRERSILEALGLGVGRLAGLVASWVWACGCGRLLCPGREVDVWIMAVLSGVPRCSEDCVNMNGVLFRRPKEHVLLLSLL